MSVEDEFGQRTRRPKTESAIQSGKWNEADVTNSLQSLLDKLAKDLEAIVSTIGLNFRTERHSCVMVLRKAKVGVRSVQGEVERRDGKEKGSK